MSVIRLTKSLVFRAYWELAMFAPPTGLGCFNDDSSMASGGEGEMIAWW